MRRSLLPAVAAPFLAILLVAAGAAPASAHAVRRTVTARVSVRETARSTASATVRYGAASATRTATASASARATGRGRAVASGASAHTAHRRALRAARRLARVRAIATATRLAKARAHSRALAAARQNALAAAQRQVAGPAAATTSTSTPCGGVGTVLVNGATWNCTFDDEFSGTALDRTYWHVVRTDEFGFFSGPECYVDDPQHVSVSGGTLNLTVTTGPTCPVTGGGYQSGAVASYAGFAQRYGRFAIRAKLPDTTSVQPALWMYPYSTTYGAWPASGEIDIAEGIGDRLGTVWPHLHYLGTGGTDPHPGTACHVANLSTQYHVFQVDWTPTLIRFSYDGKTCFSVGSWTPQAPLVAPQPFDQPFFIQLELALGTGVGAAPPSASTKLPTQMQVDWVRVWGQK